MGACITTTIYTNNEIFNRLTLGIGAANLAVSMIVFANPESGTDKPEAIPEEEKPKAVRVYT
jgi:hypothetical protein